MAIEVTESGTSITGEHVQLFQLMRLAHALSLESRTGMRMTTRGSVMNAAKRASGSMKGTKRGVLFDLIAYIPTQFPDWRATQSVANGAVDIEKEWAKRATLRKEALHLATMPDGQPIDVMGFKAFNPTVILVLTAIGIIEWAPKIGTYVVRPSVRLPESE